MRSSSATGLPRAPGDVESAKAYTARLRRAVTKLRWPRFVDDGRFEFHDQQRRFGPEELAGLTRVPASRRRSAVCIRAMSRAAASETARRATWRRTSRISASTTPVWRRSEYDALHGEGSFARIEVPGLARRQRDPERWLPATGSAPVRARAVPRGAVGGRRRARTDLGVWNVFANRRHAGRAGETLARALRAGARARRDPATPRTPGSSSWRRCCFATRSPAAAAHDRDVQDARAARISRTRAPYMHDGAFPTLEATDRALPDVGGLRRARGRLRNAAPELAGIALAPRDVEALVAFMRSLNEDYN